MKSQDKDGIIPAKRRQRVLYDEVYEVLNQRTHLVPQAAAYYAATACGLMKKHGPNTIQAFLQGDLSTTEQRALAMLYHLATTNVIENR